MIRSLFLLTFDNTFNKNKTYFGSVAALKLFCIFFSSCTNDRLPIKLLNVEKEKMTKRIYMIYKKKFELTGISRLLQNIMHESCFTKDQTNR